VHSRNVLKIDQRENYPCPCKRRGHLIPIALTEAFGCSQCQRIFVVQEGGYVLEQLATHHGHEQSWYWNGKIWYPTDFEALAKSYIPLTLGIGLLLLVLWLPVVFYSLAYTHVIGLVIVSTVLVTALILIFCFVDGP
jgi:hypothetical protein